MHVGYASDYNTVWGLCLDVELCPENGNSYIVVIKLNYGSKNSIEGNKTFLHAMPTSCLEIKAKKTTVTVGTFSDTVGTWQCSADIRFL